MAQDRPDEPTNALVAEIAALRREVAVLNGHRFIRDQNSIPRMIAVQFTRGLALGLGTVVGASVLVSIVAYFLSQIEFLPIVGDWALDLADQIQAQVEANKSGTPSNVDAAPDGDTPPARE